MSNGNDTNGYIPCDTDDERKIAARDRRIAEAHLACRRDLRPDENTPNDDEKVYAEVGHPAAANYTKGMQHNELGEVDPPEQYDILVEAARTGNPDYYNRIPKAGDRPHVNPQGAIAKDLEAPDAPQAAIFSGEAPDPLRPVPMPAAPTMRSAEAASEMGEVYWMMLTREEPFTALREAGTPSQAFQDAADNLSEFSDFRGPTEDGRVTIGTLYRDAFPGVLEGPYVSQFLLRGTELDANRGFADPFGPGANRQLHAAPGLSLTADQGYVAFGRQVINQRVFEMVAQDFMRDYRLWLEIQNGVDPANLDPPQVEEFTGRQVFINNGVQLGNYVQVDRVYQAPLVAALILQAMEVPFGPGNPYDIVDAANQTGFVTYGASHLETIFAEVANRGGKGMWYQKWNVHRRLRPETMSGRIHNVLTGAVSNGIYMLHDDIVDLNRVPASELMPRVFQHQQRPPDGSYLLGQLFAEGSPMHPAYGAGHAVFVASCVTMLKGFYKEDFEITTVYEASADGERLMQVEGARSTVLAELHKLISNIGQARNWAGVHYRSDNFWAARMGEYVAVGLLEEMARTYNEPNAYFELTLLTGIRIRIDRDGVHEI